MESYSVSRSRLQATRRRRHTDHYLRRIVALFNVYSCAVNSLLKCRHHSNGLYRRFLTSLQDAVPSTSPASQAPSSLSAILYRIELTLSNILHDTEPGRTPAYQAPSNLSESYRTRCVRTLSKAKRAFTRISHRLLGYFKRN